MKQGSLFLIACLFLISCSSNDHPPKESVPGKAPVATQSATVAQAQKLPFTGKRSFETRPAASGTGTPHRFIELMDNGEVFFSFEQENQANGSVIKERVSAGAFTPYLKCTFKNLDNETTFYEVTAEKIYEVAADHQRLTGEDCCPPDQYREGNQCPCEGILFPAETSEQ